MKPIDFPESTCVLAKDQDEYRDLPVWVSAGEDKAMISCWKLSWWERIRLLLTGKLWVRQLTFGYRLQPQLIEVGCPFHREGKGLLPEGILK